MLRVVKLLWMKLTFWPPNISKETSEKVAAIFDAKFYLAQNPDVVEAGVKPLVHFMRYGWREGRDPAPGFSLLDYASLHRLPADVNPLLHYVQRGQAESLTTNLNVKKFGLEFDDLEQVKAGFDRLYYLRCNPDVAADGIDPFDHFMAHGWHEGRNPSDAFDTAYYLAKYPDIAEGGINPFAHYILHGQAEGRRTLPQVKSAENLLNAVDWDSYDREEAAAIAPFFDSKFYIDCYPEVLKSRQDPVVHYLLAGAALGYDPRPDFSTRYYTNTYPEIAAAKHNPFVHYCRWGKNEMRQTQSYIQVARRSYRPKVSVIVPNYNHAPYLRQRITSIANQTYDNIELIILDDTSTDNSREVICALVNELGLDAKLEFNKVNAGNVFTQWQKGLSLATGDLVWICESDDFCEPDFLEHLVPAFADESVNIAFGRIQFSDSKGNFMPGLDGYREGAEPGIWNATLTRPAARWFAGGFGVNNVWANVGGGLFRRMNLDAQVWEEVRNFKICGDWFLYIHLAGGGQITYEPRAVAYFRQHDTNTSARNFHQRYYYEENMEILRLLIRRWGIPTETRHAMLGKVRAQYDQFKLDAEWGAFDTVFDTEALMKGCREDIHIQLYFLGFHPGGGELFPINLANALTGAGFVTSMVAADMQEINDDMRARLDRRVPVYHHDHLVDCGRASFLRDAGVSVINSHVASSDAFLAQIDSSSIEVPYVVTLHGSYVGLAEAHEEIITWITNNVTSWIYTADRNLEFFEDRPHDPAKFSKLPNAMPHDDRPAPFNRTELGISESDTVFILIARGVKRKGWRAAVEAFRKLRDERGVDDVHLLLIGEGGATDNARARASGVTGIHFLGYQSHINGILRLSDCMILPTRFEGESYPLCLIQAIQEHVPVIGTDLGEIRSMMSVDGELTGLLLDNQRDSAAYFRTLADAMKRMCDSELRAQFRDRARNCAEKFDMGRLVDSYLEVYCTAHRRFEKRR